MKQILIIITLIIIYTGCTNTTIETKTQIKKINQKKALNDREYQELVRVFKNDSFDNDFRLLAMQTLEKYNYPSLKTVIEEMITEEGKIREILITHSLKYDDFKYNNELKIEVLYNLIQTKKFDDFFRLYKDEKLKLESSQMNNIYENVETELNLKQFLNLVYYNEKYELYLKSLKDYFGITYGYFQGKKEEWLIKSLKDDIGLLTHYLDKINKKNYNKYKPLLKENISKLDNDTQKRVAEILCTYDDPKSFLLSDNYFIQKRAIDSYDREKSIRYYEELSENSYEKYRGLLLLDEFNDEDLLALYREKYKLEYLTLIVYLDKYEISNFLSGMLDKVSFEDKKILIEKIYSQNSYDEKLVEILFLALDLEESQEARIAYESVILNLNPDSLFKLFRKIMMEPKFSDTEKENLMVYLMNLEDQNLRSRLLKIGENNIYRMTLEKESEILLISKRIKLWEEYLDEIPSSSFKTEILNKIEKYKIKLKDIRKDIDLSSNIEYFDKKIDEIREKLFSEEDNNKRTIYQDQINRLNKEKNKYIEKNNQTIEERLSNLEEEYIYYKDKVNGLEQEIYYAKANSTQNELENLQRKKRDNLSKRQKSLEKLRIVYEKYLENNKKGISFLQNDTIKDLRGN